MLVNNVDFVESGKFWKKARGELTVPDYKRMYTLLCAAVDGVIDPLERIPAARASAEKLKDALLEAEEIYVETSPHLPEAESPGVIRLHPASEREI